MKILITGVAGFIGMNLAMKILQKNIKVIGVDVINNYYDINLKLARLKLLSKNKNFSFIKLNLCQIDALVANLKHIKPDIIVHLAGQPGVRYSTENPQSVLDNNIKAFFNILEFCRNTKVKHFLFASSSSVYGLSKESTLLETQPTDKPVSFYGASKKCNEIMAYSYSNLFEIPTTALRLFTVYGPWGRPDMAYHIFTKSILNDEKINIYNNGIMYRDFTYIDDVTECIYRLLEKPPNKSELSSYNTFNIGNNNPILLMDFINTLEDIIGKKSIKNLMPMQNGDVINTKADSEKLYHYISYSPKTELKYGLEQFYSWFKFYYNS